MIFCMKINIVFYSLIVSFLLVIARHGQSTRNSKFVILEYLGKEGRDEVDFLHADKHQTFLKVDTINLGGRGQARPGMPKLLKITSLQNLCDIPKFCILGQS